MDKPEQYRPDIDGLRALAVLAVIFFHFKIGGFTGGFTGVDVFFVISGYLIIGAIVTKVSAGTFSLLDFWERRIRRIVPASVVVLLATAVLSYFFLLIPTEFADFGRTLMAQSVFVSNWWFMGLSNYFAAPAETMPLLHTWSLAVEEQFYLLFPLVTMLVFPLVRKKFGWVLVSGAVLSFLYGVWLVSGAPTDRFALPLVPHLWGSATNSSAAFYFLVPRLWELLVGGIVAVYALRVRQRVFAEVVAFSGLIAILTGFFLVSELTPFPGFAVLLPVLGTAAVIAANTAHQTMVRKALSFPVLVWIGLISYGLYLWHWPLYVLAQYDHLPGEVFALSKKLVLLVLVFALAALSYRYIETPIRRKQLLIKPAMLYTTAAVSVLLVFGVGYKIVQQHGLPDRIPKEAQNIDVAMSDMNPRREECFTKSKIGLNPEKDLCLLGVQDATKVDFVLWGDSHADAVMPAFDAYGSSTGQTGVFFGSTGCAPLLPATPITSDQQCIDEVERAASFIQEHIPRRVYLVSEWTRGYVREGDTQGQFLSGILANTLAHMPPETEVVIMLRIPTYPNYDFRNLFFQVESKSWQLTGGLPRAEFFEATLEPVNSQIMLAIRQFPSVRVIDPLDALCDEKNCFIGDVDGLFYRDSSHISTYGAVSRILPLLLEQG